MTDTTPTSQPSRESLIAMAQAMADASDGVLRLARNEADATTGHDPEAATFLKLNGRRMGRDLEIYAFMAEVNGNWMPVLPDLAAEIVLQLRARAPEAYRIGAETLVGMGKAVYAPASHAAWEDIFTVPAPEAGAPAP